MKYEKIEKIPGMFLITNNASVSYYMTSHNKSDKAVLSIFPGDSFFVPFGDYFISQAENVSDTHYNYHLLHGDNNYNAFGSTYGLAVFNGDNVDVSITLLSHRLSQSVKSVYEGLFTASVSEVTQRDHTVPV